MPQKYQVHPVEQVKEKKVSFAWVKQFVEMILQVEISV